eukprot:341777-Prorocentrum_minimum.AAC.1
MCDLRHVRLATCAERSLTQPDAVALDVCFGVFWFDLSCTSDHRGAMHMEFRVLELIWSYGA